ncbi:collagen alpha-1(III) chain-like [Salvia hispanica]|uniref:collagen alpha-1(III) chain-like n=1 Tax=Salvia hispanica TaxID=49212 RepID=UPI002008EF3D|nr:collagen alpha-1(III) chain-like [Salvia hispanica]
MAAPGRRERGDDERAVGEFFALCDDPVRTKEDRNMWGKIQAKGFPRNGKPGGVPGGGGKGGPGLPFSGFAPTPPQKTRGPGKGGMRNLVPGVKEFTYRNRIGAHGFREVPGVDVGWGGGNIRGQGGRGPPPLPEGVRSSLPPHRSAPSPGFKKRGQKGWGPGGPPPSPAHSAHPLATGPQTIKDAQDLLNGGGPPVEKRFLPQSSE